MLRRLLRRAARHGKLLGVNEPFLYEVVRHRYPRERGPLSRAAGASGLYHQGHPGGGGELRQDHRRRHEDLRSSMLAEHKAKGETTFSGADAFKLYDTYGFPIDLTIEMVEDAGHDAGPAPRSDQADAGAEDRAPARPGRRWAIWAGPAWSSARTSPRPSLWAMTAIPWRTPRWSPLWWRTSWPRS